MTESEKRKAAVFCVPTGIIPVSVNFVKSLRGMTVAKRKRYEDVMLLAAGEEVPGHQTQYVVDSVVGLGAYGAVYLARDPQVPDRRVALKEFFPARHPRDQAPLQALFEREKMVGMQASPHPLMPTFYEAFQSDGHYYIAQEFIVGTTLDEIIARRHPLARAWDAEMVGVACAMRWRSCIRGRSFTTT